MLKTDHYIFGLGMGILIPLLLFGFILGMNYLLLWMDIAEMYLDTETHVLISLAGNLVPIRYYFVNLTYDKTGRGVLLITFVLILLFFSLKDFIISSL